QQLEQFLSSNGALRSLIQVPRHSSDPVWDASETRKAVHVDDVRSPVAFDDVHAEEIDAEGLAAAQDDPTQLRRGRERLALMAGFRTTLHLRLHAENATADREHL